MNQRALHHDVTTSPETAAQVSADGTIRLTAAQAVVRYLAAQRVETEDGTGTEPLFGGVFAIFGHGNVAGLGEA
ncbi:3D-(3,5/4)-trihydroxycyclohexane-1,2-dione acylhydrolase (decyclizing), partial [Burkholderia sp. SIMBA_051]